jgi:hypothetical protein
LEKYSHHHYSVKHWPEKNILECMEYQSIDEKAKKKKTQKTKEQNQNILSFFKVYIKHSQAQTYKIRGMIYYLFTETR